MTARFIDDTTVRVATSDNAADFDEHGAAATLALAAYVTNALSSTPEDDARFAVIAERLGRETLWLWMMTTGGFPQLVGAMLEIVDVSALLAHNTTFAAALNQALGEPAEPLTSQVASDIRHGHLRAALAPSITLGQASVTASQALGTIGRDAEAAFGQAVERLQDADIDAAEATLAGIRSRLAPDSPQ